MRKGLLDQHKPLCEKHGAQCTELPSGKDKFTTFKNWGKMLKVPFVVSALEEAQREVVCYRGDNVVEHFLMT